MTATPTFIQTPKAGLAQILPADTTTKKTLLTAGASGMKVTAVNVASTDTANRILQMWIVRAAVNFLQQTQTITALAGNDGVVAPINMFTNWPGLPTDNDGQKYLLMESGDTLQVATTTTVTAAKEVDITAVAGNF